MTTPRDPRVDPKPGDVLLKDGHIRTVQEIVGSCVVFELDGFRLSSDSKKVWAKWAKRAEVESDCRMIPSINAMKFVIQLLRKIQHTGQLDAMGFDRIDDKQAADSLRGQSNDLDQVATFLENRLAERTIFPVKKARKRKQIQ